MSQSANWLNSEIGTRKLLLGSVAVFAIVYAAAMLIIDSTNPVGVFTGMPIMLFLASWTPLIPLLGYGIQMLPVIPEGLASTLVGAFAIAVIATALTIGLRSQRYWYGKVLSFAGVAAWLLWGIACIPPA